MCKRIVIVTIGERFKFIREAAGHTQESLAVESGVSRSTVARIENGAQSPTVQMLDALVRACGSNLGDFFNIGMEDDGCEELLWKLRAVLEQGGEAATVIRWALGRAADVKALPEKTGGSNSSKKANAG